MTRMGGPTPPDPAGSQIAGERRAPKTRGRAENGAFVRFSACSLAGYLLITLIGSRRQNSL